MTKIIQLETEEDVEALLEIVYFYIAAHYDGNDEVEKFANKLYGELL